MTQLIAPAGIGNISYKEQEYFKAKDGTIEVPDDAIEPLKAFGFQVFVDVEKKGAKKVSDK